MEEAQSEVEGEKLGDYVLEGELGRGGMGRVYAARAPDGKAVAIKVVRASISDEDLLRRFDREGSLRIEHPNVVQVLDMGISREGEPFIVFERLEGANLSTVLGEPLPFAQLIDLGTQLCRGLSAVHAAGIVHRDIKPSNLFMGRDGVLTVLDFGVAALSEASTRLTLSGQVLGTLLYMAPEQVERDEHADHRADIWSIGAVLYEAAYGKPPFAETTTTATLVAIMLSDPTFEGADVSPELEAVLRKCLQKRPADRYASASALHDALASLSESSVGDGTGDPLVPAQRTPQRWAAVLAACALAACTLALGAAWSLSPAPRIAAEKSPTSVAHEEAPEDEPEPIETLEPVPTEVAPASESEPAEDSRRARLGRIRELGAQAAENVVGTLRDARDELRENGTRDVAALLEETRGLAEPADEESTAPEAPRETSAMTRGWGEEPARPRVRGW